MTKLLLLDQIFFRFILEADQTLNQSEVLSSVTLIFLEYKFI